MSVPRVERVELYRSVAALRAPDVMNPVVAQAAVEVAVAQFLAIAHHNVAAEGLVAHAHLQDQHVLLEAAKVSMSHVL
jgi:hypothetical protein